MITTQWITGGESFDLALNIRIEVFVKEQGVPHDEEPDEFDAMAEHLVVFDGDRPVATGRLFSHGDEVMLGRIAVAREERGKGFGDFTMRVLLDRAVRLFPGGGIVLHAQKHAVPFYEKFGFAAEGEEFFEAGIAHRLMRVMPENVSFSCCK